MIARPTGKAWPTSSSKASRQREGCQAQYTNHKAKDFSAILTTFKGTESDVIFYGGLDAKAGPMLRQMTQIGIAAKFIGRDGICSTEVHGLKQGISSTSPTLTKRQDLRPMSRLKFRSYS